MQQIANLWSALDGWRRAIVAASAVIVFGAVLLLGRMAAAPSMTLLYAGLESGQAGEVVSALEQRGVAYDVRGGSIFVDAARRDELRMTLASEGLPANSTKGYELLDDLSGFGTTSQMFDAAYWRAKEGELARTIMSHPAVGGARVHIAGTGSNPFRRDVQPSAAVSVTAAGGISARHARALRFLVASAVPGLVPEEVSVIDSDGGLVGAADDTPANSADDRAEEMRRRVARLLEARVGPGNAVVELSIDTVTRTESIRERRIDPDSRVAISTDSEERTNRASDQGNADVTVASNVPDGEGAQGETSSSQTNETRERVNYEVSATEREITIAPGAIERLTVAVLINGTSAVGPDGSSGSEPRSADELAALRELVASAVGYDESRGDRITIKSMPFEPLVPAGTAAQASWFSPLAIDAMSIIQAVVLAVVALVLGLFVIRPILARPAAPAPAQLAPPPGQAAGTGSDVWATVPPPPLSGEIDDDRPADGAGAEDGQPQALPALRTAAEDDPVERLRGLIAERQEETVEILRNWLEGEEETV